MTVALPTPFICREQIRYLHSVNYTLAFTSLGESASVVFLPQTSYPFLSVYSVKHILKLAFLGVGLSKDAYIDDRKAVS